MQNNKFEIGKRRRIKKSTKRKSRKDNKNNDYKRRNQIEIKIKIITRNI